MAENQPDQLAGIGALAEPARRALYEYVASAPEPVSREQAAEAVGVAVHSAKFHLDKLVDQGLLEVQFRRLTGRSGPGAGRPAKLYRRSHHQFSVSLPERRYDLAGEVLAAAVDSSLRDGVPVADAVRAEAERRGRRMATGVDEDRPAGPALEVVATALSPYGYEPRVEEGELRLANCPFHSLASEHTELVCGMNLGLIDGVLDELTLQDVRAVLAPHEGYCCVRVRPEAAC